MGLSQACINEQKRALAKLGEETIEGVVCVEGIAAGKVYYENAVLKGVKPGDGTYRIETDDFSRTEVPYTAFFKTDDAITVEI